MEQRGKLTVIKKTGLSTNKESYLWMGLNLVDFLLTSIALAFGAMEANFFMQTFGINGISEMFLWKLILVCGVLIFLGTVRIPYADNERVLHLTNRIMVVVCVWNVGVLSVCVVRG